ncbi:MAG: hypothetical protein LC798_06425 [Chloroflexi bacterium]|nr:hypothetical protein [Chloroflexota bacterium]
MRAAADRDPEGFWGAAADLVHWFRAPTRTFEPDPPSFRWFVGGRTNLSYNAVDAHVRRAAHRGATRGRRAACRGGGPR